MQVLQLMHMGPKYFSSGSSFFSKYIYITQGALPKTFYIKSHELGRNREHIIAVES